MNNNLALFNSSTSKLVFNSKMPRLSVSGPYFMKEGKPFRIRNFTYFGLGNVFAHDENISAQLKEAFGYNCIRWFLYTDWNPNGWNVPSFDVAERFINYLALNGFYVEIVLLTSDDESKIIWANAFVTWLTLQQFPNVIIEIGNEPFTHKTIHIESLHASVAQSGYLFSSGAYDDPNKFFGSYFTDHTDRNDEWVRKSKELEEFYSQFKIPCLADEPAKLQDVKFDLLDAYTYAALASLAGAGACCHTLSAETGGLLTSDEKNWATAFLAGLNVFPDDACHPELYKHLTELEGNGEKALRVFSFGRFAVVVRPNNFIAPSNWKSLDSHNVAWEIQ